MMNNVCTPHDMAGKPKVDVLRPDCKSNSFLSASAPLREKKS